MTAIVERAATVQASLFDDAVHVVDERGPAIPSGDALSAGLVTSLARPGGNVTGSTYFLSELMAKRLELLKAAMPQMMKAAVLVNPGNPLFDTTVKALESAAKSLNIDLQQIRVAGLTEFEAAFLAIAKERADAIVIQEDAVFVSNAKEIVDLASKQRLPLAGNDELAEAGGIFLRCAAVRLSL
jgi:ABC-type uncharacterized transport system substrate-binding protein